jgi:HlyD family secretion protein
MDVIREGSHRSKRLRTIRRWAIVIATVATGALGLCHLKPSPPAIGRANAWIDTVRRGTLLIQLRGSGVLTPEDVRWVPATTDGRVERIYVQPGVAVTADEVLIEISNPELLQTARDAELQLRAADAELRNRQIQIERDLLAQEAVTATARAEYEEARLRAAADAELASNGLVSALILKFSKGREGQLHTRVEVEQKRLDLARSGRKTDVAAAQARVDQVRALFALKRQQVDALHVRAGIAGVLQQVAVEVGQRVTAGAILAKVAAPQPLRAVIQVSEVQASQVVAGQEVEVDIHTGVVRGTVTRIDPAVKNGSVTIDVRLPRDLPNGARPDLSVDALIDIDRVDNALFVGRPVQVEPNGSVNLFVIDGTTAARRRIRIGRASYNAIEILEGLHEGDRVILSDTAAFDRFDRITITN